MPTLVSAFLQQKNFVITETHIGDNLLEKTLIGRNKPDAPSMQIEIAAHGSATAFKDLAAGTTDLGMSSRKIKPEERDQLSAQYGDLSSAAHEHVIALDALAIIVAPDSPLQQLSMTQLAQIFSGDAELWNKLTGLEGAPHLYARDDNSGTWDTFEHLVLKPAQLKLSPDAKRIESSETLRNAVQHDKYAIGFVGVAYARDVGVVAISNAQGLAVKPDAHLIGTEIYPLSRRLYMYAPNSADDSLAQEFLRFVVSNAGQKLVEQAGLISYYPIRDKPLISAASLPRPYLSLSTLAERLSVRFTLNEQGQIDEVQSKRDIERLAHFFNDHPDKRLVLATFSNNSAQAGGDTQLNDLLAHYRIKSLDRVVVSNNSKSGTSDAHIETWAL